MDELFYDAIDMLKVMIGISSFSREENEVADKVEDFLNKWGLRPHRSGNNLWCISENFNPAKPTILLNSHIDTVKPGENWTFAPLEATETDEGRIYGLGSNDAGASVVSLLSAYRYLTTKEQPYNMIFLASCEEEVGGKHGIESVLPMLPPIDVAIVGEPTEMQPAIAEKGLMVLDGEITGVAGHAARNEGVNAIYKAVDVVNEIRNMKFDKESELLGPVKVTVTQIDAGSQHNVVPDMCRIVVDVRTTDAYSNQETLDMIKQRVRNCTLKARSTRLNSSKISPSHTLVSRLVTLGKVPFGSPTLSDQSLMSFESLKMGPGASSRSHTADEYIDVQEIREAIHTYITLLDGCDVKK